MPNKKLNYTALDLKLIAFFRRNYLRVARASIFLIFFWFGAIKLMGLSPAGPLARALVASKMVWDIALISHYILTKFRFMDTRSQPCQKAVNFMSTVVMSARINNAVLMIGNPRI